MRKQLNALEGDSSEEARKRKQQLKSDLAKAEQEQKDTLYDRSVEDSISALDKMVTDSEDMATQYLKDSEKVFVDALAYINAHTQQVSQNLEQIAKETGFDISNYIAGAWEDSGDAVGDYSSTLSSNVPNIIAQIELITSAWQAQTEAIEANAETVKKSTVSSYSEYSSTGASTSGTSSDGNSTENTDKKLEEVDAFMEKSLSKAGHKQDYYASLNQYIYGVTGGYVLTKQEEAELADILGVSLKTDLTGTEGKKEINKILKALQNLGWGQRIGTRSFSNIGFSTGGLVDASELIKKSGEDGIALVKNGEYILSQKQTDGFLKLSEYAPQLAESLKNMPMPQWNSPNLDIYRNLPIVDRTPSVVNNFDNRVTVEGVATDKIVKDFENVATKQAENVVAKINSMTYAKGVRR